MGKEYTAWLCKHSDWELIANNSSQWKNRQPSTIKKTEEVKRPTSGLVYFDIESYAGLLTT
jgi:hypothetical protein